MFSYGIDIFLAVLVSYSENMIIFDIVGLDLGLVLGLAE